MKEKTSKEEQIRRQEEYQKVVKRYEELIFWKNTNSPEFRRLNCMLYFGPTYDYLLADIEDPEYRDAFENHPLDYEPIYNEYVSRVYGKRVSFQGYGKGVIECLAYDYGDFYYKFIPEGKEKPVYIPLINKYESD
jgi:hypothetical protein